MSNRGIRDINILLGVWLFLSAFLWPHTPAQFANTWIVGALVSIFALIGLAAPPARFLNTILAVWLFISTWALPTISSATVWNNVIVAIGVFIVSLLQSDTPAERHMPRGPRTTRTV